MLRFNPFIVHFTRSSLVYDLSRFSFSTCEGRSAESSAPPSQRCYYYYISESGHVYVIDADQSTMPHGPVFLKDRRAVNFLFRRLQRNSTPWYLEQYPWYFTCQGELNFVRSADRPIVFHALQSQRLDISLENDSLKQSNSPETAIQNLSLEYGMGLLFPFSLKQLAMSPGCRLYHPSPLGWGLLSSALVGELTREHGLEMASDGAFHLLSHRIPLIPGLGNNDLNETTNLDSLIGIDGRDK